jgi:hypothetical protein
MPTKTTVRSTELSHASADARGFWDRRSPRNALKRRWLRRTLAALVALVLVWLVGGYFVLVHPPTNKPRKVDAIFVLGPPQENNRLGVALSLINAGYSKTLAISAVTSVDGQSRKICKNGLPGVAILCFQPSPFTTQGEAQYIAREAKAKNWTSVLIVTSSYHVLRARVLVDRCFHGDVLMVAATKSVDNAQIRYQYFYQTGAWLKALVHRGC